VSNDRSAPVSADFSFRMSDCQIRLMQPGDLAFADSLRALAGWNQTLADWRRFLVLEPEGCFVAEFDGAPAGTATTIRYGNRIGWIGMVLVHPEKRRLGIGRALLNHSISYLKGRGVRSIKLDATLLGQKLYETMGFVPEWTLTRWRGRLEAVRLKFLPPVGVPKIASLDAAVFGADRSRLLERLAADGESAAYEREGFAMLRRGARAWYLGPVVAKHCGVAFEVMDTLLMPGEFIVDIPDRNDYAADWARSKWFKPERQLTRMRLGPEIRARSPETLYAIAAPEVG
jgi:GNAT superfamily N-acetyltransferase